MEHLIYDSVKPIITNSTETDIEVSVDKAYTLSVAAGECVSIVTKNGSIVLSIREKRTKISWLYKIFGIITATIISIPLWLLNVMEFESIEKSIKLPVEFELTVNGDNEIFILDSDNAMQAYAVKINDEKIEGTVKYTYDDLRYEYIKFIESFIILLIFPIVITIIMLVLTLKYKNLGLIMATIIFIVLLIFCTVKTIYKSKRFIKKLMN